MSAKGQIVACILFAASTVAHALPPVDDDDVTIEQLPRELRGVEVIERTGQQLPLDTPFVDEDGNPITLGTFFDGERPVILTFNYTNCPMLCNMQLAEFSKVLERLKLTAGKQFRIVTIGLDHNEPPTRAKRAKAGYLQRFSDTRRAFMKSGWQFVTGTKADIRRVANAAGFGYQYVPRRNEIAHSTALIFVSPNGMITRYIKGIQYDELDVAASVLEAGQSKQGDSIGWVLSCFHYDPNENSYAAGANRVMFWGATGFAVSLLIIIALVIRLRKRPGDDSLGSLGVRATGNLSAGRKSTREENA